MSQRKPSNQMALRTIVAGLASTGIVLGLAGCVPNDTGEAASATRISVTSTTTECTVDAQSAPSGPITFSTTNAGDKVTEFYILAEDKKRIVGEVENIATGVTRDLTIVAEPGTYYTVCKPGMVGDGVGQAKFTVTGETGAASVVDKEATAAVETYTSYVRQQIAELISETDKLTAAYISGDDEAARALFPSARIGYERIEPVAEQFGGLDPRIDYRKPGAEAAGVDFTGFHRIEMDLWLSEAQKNYPTENITALDAVGRSAVAGDLVTDVKALADTVNSASFELTIGDITNGAISLLDEVAAPDGKLAGEEDEFSHTDLWDFFANVEGAEEAFTTVRDIALGRGDDGKKLVDELDAEFATMKELLGTYGNYETGFVSYETVDQNSRNELGAQLNALSEPLSKLTHTVLVVQQ